jgi:hypothetical protein
MTIVSPLRWKRGKGDPGIAGKWFVVVDPELKDLRGHYLDYDRAVADAAVARGFAPLILANKALDPSVSGLPAITPAFSRGIWHERPRLAAFNRSLSRIEATRRF